MKNKTHLGLSPALGLQDQRPSSQFKPLMPSNLPSDGRTDGSVLWGFYFPFPLSTEKKFLKGDPSLGLVGRYGTGAWRTLSPPTLPPHALTSYMAGTVGLRTCFPRKSPDIGTAVASHSPHRWPCGSPTGLSLFLSNLPVWSSPEIIS